RHVSASPWRLQWPPPPAAAAGGGFVHGIRRRRVGGGDQALHLEGPGNRPSLRAAGEHRVLGRGSQPGGVPGHGAAREHRLQRRPRRHLERHHLHRPCHRRLPRRQLLGQVQDHPRLHRLLPR
ncbi:hypothetical protein ACJX0J_007405, partial [Zea mays]